MKSFALENTVRSSQGAFVCARQFLYGFQVLFGAISDIVQPLILVLRQLKCPVNSIFLFASFLVCFWSQSVVPE